MRRLIVLLMLVLALLTGSAAVISPASELTLVTQINELRAARGVAPLVESSELTNWAHWWARYMAEHDHFAHSDIGVLLDPWWIVGENIGTGGDPMTIFHALTQSPSHLQNMVDARFSAVGVGAFWDGWRLWTVQVFAA